MENKFQPIFCPDITCGQMFGFKRERMRHIKKHHDNSIHCPYDDCMKRLSASGFEKHLGSIHEKTDPTVLCTRCGKIIKKSSLKSHEELCTSDGVKKFLCSHFDCKSAFTTERALRHHIGNYHKPKIDCPVKDCDAKVRSSYLSMHMKLNHDDCKRECGSCGRFFSPLSFSEHLKMCTSDGHKMFYCTREDCDASFLTKKYRSEHERRSHSKKLVKCPFEGCETFIKPFSLKRHVEAIHQQVKKTCEKCGKQSSTSSYYRHIGKCVEICPQKFESPDIS